MLLPCCSAHWFLAIICFPGLKGCVRMCDGLPVTFQPKATQRRPKVAKPTAKEAERTTAPQSIQIGSTTITFNNTSMKQAIALATKVATSQVLMKLIGRLRTHFIMLWMYYFTSLNFTFLSLTSEKA